MEVEKDMIDREQAESKGRPKRPNAQTGTHRTDVDIAELAQAQDEKATAESTGKSKR